MIAPKASKSVVFSALLLGLVGFLPGLAAAADEPANAVDVSAVLTPPKKAKWDPKGKAIDPFGRGDAKRKQEAWNDAMPLLLESLKVQPGCGKCLNSLALALTGSKRFDDAVKVGEVMHQLFPDRKDGLRRISDTHADAQREQECVEATTRYLEELDDKANSTMWWRRNRFLLQLGEFETAGSWLDKAEAATLPKQDTACLRIQLLAAQKEPVAAREMWSTCDGSENLDLKRYTEGWLAYSEGDIETAAKRLVLAGADDFARLTIALLRLDQKKHDLALNLSVKLLEEQDWAMDAHLVKALALHGMGKPDEALAELDASLMGEGWQDRLPKLALSDVLLRPRGTAWPNEVGQLAAALKLRVLSEKGDAEGAQALYEAAIAVFPNSAALTAAKPSPPTAVAPTP